jgi:hypothetical protein
MLKRGINSHKEIPVKHIKKVKPAPQKASSQQSEGEPRPIKHIRPCIPVDGG